MIDPEQVYGLTPLGERELAAAGTALSPAELELLVLNDGRATVGQVQASAQNLAPGEVSALMEKLLSSGHIALQVIGLDDDFGRAAPRQSTAAMPDESVIERGVSSLRQHGYMVRIARKPQAEHRLELSNKHALMAALDRKLKVIVVEDDETLAQNMRLVLTRAGFVVRVAANREQIVATLRQPPLADLVLLDVTLPDGSGFDVLADMRRHPMLVKVPAIMVTGSATREAVLRGLQEGADGYITKPFEIEVLVKAVRTVLALEGAEQEAGEAAIWMQAARSVDE
jgi:CheY-like chemotaxis protein